MSVRGGVVLGVVPGLAAVGWGLVRLAPRHEEVLNLGVICTHVRWGRGTSDPDGTLSLHARTRAMAEELAIVMRREQLVAIASCPPPVQVRANGGGADYARRERRLSELHRAWGVLDAFSVAARVPIVECQDADIRAAVAREPAADISTALRKRYPGEHWRELEDDVAKVELRALAEEALGAVIACSEHEALRPARRVA